MDELFVVPEKRHNNLERVIMIEDIILIKLERLWTCVGEQKTKLFLFFVQLQHKREGRCNLMEKKFSRISFNVSLAKEKCLQTVATFPTKNISYLISFLSRFCRRNKARLTLWNVTGADKNTIFCSYINYGLSLSRLEFNPSKLIINASSVERCQNHSAAMILWIRVPEKSGAELFFGLIYVASLLQIYLNLITFVKTRYKVHLKFKEQLRWERDKFNVEYLQWQSC